VEVNYCNTLPLFRYFISPLFSYFFHYSLRANSELPLLVAEVPSSAVWIRPFSFSTVVFLIAGVLLQCTVFYNERTPTKFRVGALITPSILLRGIQLTHVQRYRGTNVKMVFSYKLFTFHEASVITTIMDQKVQLLKPLNKRELNTTKQNPHRRENAIFLYETGLQSSKQYLW
jgi:hypothetical protein